MRMRSGKRNRGQALIEYIVILMCVTVVSLGAVSLLGHNIGDLYATAAAILPGSEPSYDQPAYVGEFMELHVAPVMGKAPGIELDMAEIVDDINSGAWRLDDNLTNDMWTGAWSGLVFEKRG